MTKPDERPWLVIIPEIQTALLIALLRREGGSINLLLAELQGTADVTWELEATQNADGPGQHLVRLRERRS
ncbi:hypothetical protein [Jiangella alkaliphila]|uniref:hypothetical protein n=1 Tax=Jiangella alkaliphila TaxID=419479 RepID=UPI00128D9720|nr:hypothetical protein [Jiangella alkaliphila]